MVSTRKAYPTPSSTGRRHRAGEAKASGAGRSSGAGRRIHWRRGTWALKLSGERLDAWEERVDPGRMRYAKIGQFVLVGMFVTTVVLGACGGSGGVGSVSGSVSVNASGTTTGSGGSTSTSTSSGPTTSSEATTTSGGGNPGICPGESVSIALGETLPFMGNTTGASDKFMGVMNGVGNCFIGNMQTKGPDWVYEVIPSDTGTLVITLTADFPNADIQVRTACPGTILDIVACDYNANKGMPITATVSVVAGMKYYVAADGYMNTSGSFALTLTLN